ncbi:MAG: V4R domain-containing protein [Anaerolineales bacterium]
MTTISGANALARSFWMALEEILGQEQVRKVGESPLQLFDGHPFSLAQLAALQGALEGIYGIPAGRGVALRSGRAWVKYGLRFFYEELGWNRSEFRLLPRNLRIERGLESLASWMNGYFTERFDVRRIPEGWIWRICGSPDNTEKVENVPGCYWMIGVLEEVLHRLGDGKIFLVREISCRACGAASCLFEIPARPLGD